MKFEEIPDKNIFMISEALNPEALSDLPAGFYARNCREDEIGIWKAMPFDDPADAIKYGPFMDDFFQAAYAGKETLFFEKTLFICNESDDPIATCAIWKAYDEFNSIHWLKVKKEYEGKGIGRALLSLVMKELAEDDYPVYLHTQPASFRAIKLYSDFGFSLLSGDKFGSRKNHLDECLPILKEFMPEKDFLNLKMREAPESFKAILEKQETIQF